MIDVSLAVVAQAPLPSYTSLESGESSSCILYSDPNRDDGLPDDQRTTSGSSSSLSRASVVDAPSPLALQTYHSAITATTKQDALRLYQTALDLFQTTTQPTSPRSSKRKCSTSKSSRSSFLYEALCRRAMARLVISTDPLSALALYDESLKSLEAIMNDVYRYSEPAEHHVLSSAGFCLDTCFVETLLQKSATLMASQQLSSSSSSSSYSTRNDEAMECAVQALRFLLDVRLLDHTRRWEELAISCLTNSQHSQQLLTTMEQILQQYTYSFHGSADVDTRVRLSSAKEQEPAWMQQVEQALHVLQTRHHELTKEQRLSVAYIQNDLSFLYMHFDDLERGSQALIDACDLLLQEHEQPQLQLLDRMEDVATRYEELSILDQAMICYEKVLLGRNQCLGSSHVQVAGALVNVARVMQLQGNDDGSMDLWQAAEEIYKRQTDYDALEPVFREALQHERWDQAIIVLLQCIELAEAKVASKMDKRFIYYSLAQGYIGRGEYVSATMCLMEAKKLREESSISEKDISALLQSVKRLRQEEYQDDSSDYISDEDSEGRYSELSPPGTDVESLPTGAGDEQYYEEVADFGAIELVSAFGRVLDVHDREYTSTNTQQLGLVLVGTASDQFNLQDSNLRRAQATVITKTRGAPMDDETRCDDKTSPTVASPAPSDAHPFTNDAQKPQGSASLAKGSSHSSYNVLKRLGCPSKKSRNGPASVSDLSQRSGLLQTIVNSFRRHDQDQFKSSTTQEATLQLDSQNVQQGVTTLPSEKEFHLAVDATQFVGPVGLIHVKRTSSWDSDISSITVRMEEFRSTLDSKQELWWGATAGGFGRWFPTVVTTAVEAAEGFLSARAIHSQKKRTPLFEYQSSGDSEDEHESVAVANFPLKQQLTHLEEPHVVKDLRGSKSGMRGASSTGVLNGSGVQSLYSADVRRADEVASQIRRYNELIMEQESRYGKQDLQLATSLFALAVLHSQEGAAPGMEAAIECATEALRIQNERGAAHAALRSIHFLADLHVHQKQFDSSLTLYMEALLMEYNQFGDTSDEAAKTLNCIGTVHSLQNAFSRAMESHQEALRILQNSHGDNLKHPLISATLCHIGSVYYRERNSFSQSKPYADSYTTFIEAGMLETIGRAHEDRGSYKMAISFFEERLLVLESGGPASDPEKLDEVAETLNSLGMLSSRAGRFAQAIDYYEKGLKVQSTLGCDAVQLATVRVLIGAAHFQLGNWHRALRFYEESLDVLLRDLGREHETVAATLYHIGIVHASFYHLDKAMLSLSDAVQIQLRLLGPKHPATLRSRREIGNLFAVSLSRRDAALEVFDEVLLIQRTIHGDRHPNIAETLSSIGLAYARRGDYASALQILEETYHMRAEFLGNDVPSQASILYEISLIHLRRKHFKRALRICDVVLAIREESLRDKHIDTALTICLKGSCFAAQNKLDEADVLLANAVEMAVATVGDWHPTVAEIHVARSSLHLRRCHFDLSRECVERALEIYEKANLNDDFQPYVEAKQQLTRIEHDEALFV